MAEKKKETAPVEVDSVETAPVEVDPSEELVDLFIPREANEGEDHVTISVNYRTFHLPVGKTSKVPRFIYNEWQRAQKSAAAYYDRMDELKSK